MKILETKSLKLPEIKVIRFARFQDHRGYFTELFRKSDFLEIGFMKGVEFLQCNESASRRGTVRGLHFQWNPYIGKLIRTVRGRMIDLVLDIRKGSPNFGKIIAYDMPADSLQGYGEWIWVPPGFAHGNFFTEESQIEYFCSGEYSPNCEVGISPLARDIDWSLSDSTLKALFYEIAPETSLMTEKDRNGFTLDRWKSNGHSEKFVFGLL